MFHDVTKEKRYLWISHSIILLFNILTNPLYNAEVIATRNLHFRCTAECFKFLLSVSLFQISALIQYVF